MVDWLNGDGSRASFFTLKKHKKNEIAIAMAENLSSTKRWKMKYMFFLWYCLIAKPKNFGVSHFITIIVTTILYFRQ
jgi:hypothetical protein